MTDFILHNYFRSSTSFRVRIALNLKGLSYDYLSYHLKNREHHSADFQRLNAQELVPALELSDGNVLTQSMAIIEWLDESFPNTPLIPKTAIERARVRSLAQMVGCDIHPVNNLRVLEYLRTNLHADDDGIALWFKHWVDITFAALEHRLNTESSTGAYCHGDTAGLADLCLVAQVFNNKRFSIDMTPYPTIMRIFNKCMQLDAFHAARPSAQIDA